MNSENTQLDVNKVLQKLQNKLGEALTNSAILEARVEQLEEQLGQSRASQSEMSNNL